MESRSRSAPLVIADGERPVALAGIMGGRFAETAEGTSEVLVEAAHFDPVLIRQTVQQVDLGMESRGTAASYRFERGTDPNLMLEGALGTRGALDRRAGPGHARGPVRRSVSTASRMPASEHQPGTNELPTWECRLMPRPSKTPSRD